MRPRTIVFAVLLSGVAATWALGGFERSSKLASMPAPRTAIDAGVYSVKLQSARARPVTNDEVEEYSNDGIPDATRVVELRLLLRNESDYDAIDLSQAIRWNVPGEPKTKHDDPAYERADFVGRQHHFELDNNHPVGVWVPIRGRLPLRGRGALPRSLQVTLYSIVYHDLGDAFGNILGFRSDRLVGTYEFELDRSSTGEPLS